MNQLKKQCIYFFAFSLVFLSCTLLGFSQSDRLSEVTRNYFFNHDYLKENIHLHLNKTTFLKGESLWFTAYVQDQNNQLPSFETKNLYVGIYSQDGQELEKKLILIENGVGTGQIELDSTFVENDYYLRAATNWMRNFEFISPFEQKIKVLGNRLIEPEAVANQSLTIDYYIEGGKFVEGLENKIVFWIRDSRGNKPIFDRIQIKDHQGNSIVSGLNTNLDGYGSALLNPDRNSRYHLEIDLVNGDVVTEELPAPSSLDFNLQLSSIHPNYLLGSLKIHSESIAKLSGQSLYLGTHKDNLFRIEEIPIDDNDIKIRLEKNNLPFGINMITVFDQDMRSVLKRPIFNEAGKQDRLKKLNFKTEFTKNRDSLKVVLTTESPVETSLSLSVSVLPSNTRSFQPQNSLLSSMLLMPYMSNSISFPVHYLESYNRQSIFDLDLLMLAQANNGDDWNQRNVNSANHNYEFERGILIEGRVMNSNPEYENEIWGITNPTKASMLLPLEKDKTFNTNQVLYSGDTLKLSLMGKRGKLRVPKVELEVIDLQGWELPLEKRTPAYLYTNNRNQASVVNTKDINVDNFSLELDDRTIRLDEVVLREKLSKQKEIKINSALFSAKRILKDDIQKNRTLSHYLRRLGYRPRIIEDGKLQVISKSIPPGQLPYRVPVPVYVNGMITNGYEIANLPLSRVASVTYDNAGYKFIAVQLRANDYYYDQRKRYTNFIIEQGYSRPEKYFNPGYPDYQSQEFLLFGAIDWIPKVYITDDEGAEIIFPTLDQQKIFLQVEGMGEDGSLISQSIEIELPQE